MSQLDSDGAKEERVRAAGTTNDSRPRTSNVAVETTTKANGAPRAGSRREQFAYQTGRTVAATRYARRRSKELRKQGSTTSPEYQQSSRFVKGSYASGHRVGRVAGEIKNAAVMVEQKTMAAAIWGELSVLMLWPIFAQLGFSAMFILSGASYSVLPNVPLIHFGGVLLWFSMLCWIIVSITAVIEMVWALVSYLAGGVHVLRSNFLLITFMAGIALSLAPPYVSFIPWGLVWGGLVILVVK